MANYYEILKIQPTVSEKEIEAAIIQQYDQWRRLVTHHDSNIANQANQALALLEQMRVTLLDPAKRDVYDMAVGVKASQVGGLADPSVLLDSLRMITPPSSNQVQPEVKPASNTVDAWMCSDCHTANPTKTKFCSRCGKQLGITCPSCNNLLKAGDPFCAECGKNIAEETNKAKTISSIVDWTNITKSQIMKQKHAPAVRSLIAQGTFPEIYKICYDVITTYEVTQATLRIPIHDVASNASSGELSGELSSFYTFGTKYTIKVVIQNNQLLDRGVVILGLSNRSFNGLLYPDMSFIVDPYTQLLLNKSDRFRPIR